MNKIIKQGFIFLTISILVISCKKASDDEGMSENTANPSADSISSSAAVEKEGSTRKFIRTADLKFRVKNVTQSTYIIENITNKFDGFVTHTDLHSNIIDKFETKISQDSTLETTRYSVENNITIRVPNKHLDTIIRTIAKQIDFLDYRIINAEDVSLKMLSNQLSQKRSNNTGKRIEKDINTKEKKITNIVDAENNLAKQKEQNDNAKLRNLSIQDQINFSTLAIQIYQRESIRQEMNANSIRNEDYYKPNIGIRIVDSLKIGGYVFLDIIVFLFRIWWLFSIVIGGLFLYRKYGKNHNKQL